MQIKQKVTAIVSDAVSKAIAEAVEDALLSDETYATLPAVFGNRDGFGGEAPEDPLVVYFVLDIAGDGCGEVVWSRSITDMLAPDIAACECDGSYTPGLKRISEALRALADKIDGAIK